MSTYEEEVRKDERKAAREAYARQEAHIAGREARNAAADDNSVLFIFGGWKNPWYQDKLRAAYNTAYDAEYKRIMELPDEDPPR